MEKKYQSTLNYTLLIYVSVIVLIITLSPFDFRTPGTMRIFWILYFQDFIISFILFVPVGLLFTMSRRKHDLFSHLSWEDETNETYGAKLEVANHIQT
jgi:hypothetical protein